MVSASHTVSAASSSSHSSPAPAWGSTHGRQFCTNFSSMRLSMGSSSSRTAPLWVIFMGCSASGTGCSGVGLHGVTSPASKPASAWGPLSTGSQVLVGACSSLGSPQGHNLLQAHPPAPAWGPPWAGAAGGYLLHCVPAWAAGGQPASPWSSPQAAGESLLQHLDHLPLLLP